MNNQKIDVAIIGAMDEEVAALLALMDDYEKHAHMHSVYYVGMLQGKRVVVFQSGLGKVNAALAAAFVLERFAPRYVMNIGSAGGLDEGLEERLNIGDVVVSSAALYHDVDVTLLGLAYGQLPGMPVVFEADAKLVALTEQAVREATQLRSVKGVIGSGDAFMSDPAQIALVRGRFPQVVAVDMEAAAVAHTCYLYDTPFVVIRAISDVVTRPDNHVDFFSFLPKAAANSAKVVERVVALLT